MSSPSVYSDGSVSTVPSVEEDVGSSQEVLSWFQEEFPDTVVTEGPPSCKPRSITRRLWTGTSPRTRYRFRSRMGVGTQESYGILFGLVQFRPLETGCCPGAALLTGFDRGPPDSLGATAGGSCRFFVLSFEEPQEEVPWWSS